MPKVIFDFTEPEAVEAFHPIDDRVMGGVSESGLTGGKGCALFRGEVSFEHHGGFASVRSAPGSWDLSGYTGIELTVRGDGKTYKLSVTTDPRFDSVVYRCPFVADDGDWQTVRVPFSDFVPTFRGERVQEAGTLDPSAIDSFGFLISDRQEGPFRLAVKSIRAY